jgi:hypothetical protein
MAGPEIDTAAVGHYSRRRCETFMRFHSHVRPPSVVNA